MSSSKVIRIAIADGDVVVRNHLRAAFEGEPDMHVVGVASNGPRADELVESLEPDVLVLGLALPDAVGGAPLPLRRSTHSSVLTLHYTPEDSVRGSVACGESGALASRWVHRPSALAGRAPTSQLQRELVSAVRELVEVGPVRLQGGHVRAPQARATAKAAAGHGHLAPFNVLAIGSSTGGPDALAKLFADLPAELPVPLFLVQHMPAEFTRHLAERLDQLSGLEVREAREGDPVRPGHAYVAPGGMHMEVRRRKGKPVIHTHSGEPVHSCRPAVDVLFESLVDAYGGGVLAVVLTGLGRDGTMGSTALRRRGARVIAQDEASSVVWGMPGEVVRAGQADLVLPLEEIAKRCAHELLEGTRRHLGPSPAA